MIINIGPAYIRLWARGHGVGWVVEKDKTEKQDDTNSRVWSGYDVYMHPKRVIIPLLGLDRCVLTVGAI